MRIRIMVPRRIIADSDDEDDSFSPSVSPRKPPPPARPHLGSSSDALANATSSTDSRFFESVYHQQAAGIPSHQTPKDDSQNQEDPLTAHLSPLPETTYVHPDDIPGTEPVPTPTQVATPGNVRRGMSTRDIWDVPSSGEQGGSTTIERSTDNDRPTKKRKTVQMASSGPSETTPGTRGRALFGQPALYIDPQTLSPNRRMLYQSIQPSSDDQTQEHTEPSAAVMNKSSGSATIAYPTPTQARSFMARAADSIAEEPYPAEESHPPEEPSLIEEPHAGLSAGVVEPQSSPDILVTHKAPRARRAAEQSFDEICGPDDEEFPEERYKPRPSKRRAPTESMEGSRATTALFDPGPDSLPPKKRRGRPRKSKEGTSEDGVDGKGESKEGPVPGVEVDGTSAPAEAGPVSAENLEQAESGAQEVAPAKGKRKRGRPRKADKAPPVGDDEDTELKDSKDQVKEEAAGRNAVQEGSQPETPLEKEAKAEAEEDQAEAAAPPKADDDIAQEASAASPAPARAPVQAKDEKGVTRDPPTTPASAGKPVYRVGLSKRSRIAPLLKSLRKT